MQDNPRLTSDYLVSLADLLLTLSDVEVAQKRTHTAKMLREAEFAIRHFSKPENRQNTL